MNNETDEKLEEKYSSCIKSLESKNEIDRTPEDIQNIQTYLNTLFYFRRLSLYDPVNVDNTILKISNVIKYISIPKNNYVLKLGEKGNAFYLILKGKVSIMIAEYKKVYLTIEDYLIFLLKLFYFNEKELLKETIFLNKHRYMIEGNFENYIKNLYKKQKRYEKEIRNEDKNDKKHLNIKKEKRNIFSDSLIKMIEKIFPDLASFSEKKNSNDKSNIFLDYIFNNNFKENEVTPDKLISLINIDNYSSYEKYLYKAFSIPFYFQINVLERGKYFGHTALETNSKGSLTIITLEDSSFGIIEKNDYFRLLSKINKELDMNFYSTLYNLPFFKSISKSVFQRFYSSFFEYHLYKRNTILYEMKKETNLLYLINNGRFSIYIKGNIIDVYDILIYLQQEKNYKINKNKNVDEDELYSKIKIIEKDERDDLIYNKNFKSKEFNDAVFAQNEIYLGNFEGNNLIGLIDFVDKKTNMSLFNIKIESNFCELYEISKKNFKIIVSDYSCVNDLVEDYEMKKLNLLINKIISYKNLFFATLKQKENDKISTRLNIQKKEKEIEIQSKTQKSLKSEKINKNLYLSLNTDRYGKTTNYKFITNDPENNIWSNSCRTLGDKIIKKNASEKKRRMLIKEKILEKQNKELFLLENGDVNYKSKVFGIKKKLFSKDKSNKKLSINKLALAKENSNLLDNVPINNINKKNLKYILSDNFFVNKIKEAMYINKNNNNNSKVFNTINNNPVIPRIKNKKKIFYMNILMNDKNYASSKKLLLNNNSKNNFRKTVNKSVGTIKKIIDLNIDMTKNNKNLDEKIKIDNNKLEILRNKETMNKIKQKIEEYRKRENAIFEKLKININKMQNDIHSTNLYSMNRQKFIDKQNESKNNKVYDEDIYF